MSDRNPLPPFIWEELNMDYNQYPKAERAKVPGGWLVVVQASSSGGTGITFYPDPDHRWDGGTLP